MTGIVSKIEKFPLVPEAHKQQAEHEDMLRETSLLVY